jgi:hypothetical protein
MDAWTVSAANEELRIGHRVAYAGLAVGRNRRPTINVGEIDMIDRANDKVRVVRGLQSGNDIFDTDPQRVWVATSKVVRAYPTKIH